MTLSFPSPEFDDAVAAACHGSASETEMRALNALLRSESGARDEYLFRVELHSRLASDPDFFCGAHEAVLSDPILRKVDVASEGGRNVLSPNAGSNTGFPATKRRAMQILAFAACLMLTAIGLWSPWMRRSSTRNGATSTAMAMLTRVVDARWSHDTAAVRVGSALAPGWLRLESGLAQIVFYSGARVVIEGPAELQIVSATEAVCTSGRLLAEVPQPARGFRIRTGELNVVDLGTEFGMDAGRGRSEVHVFKGKVEVLSGKAEKQPLVEGEAVAVEGTTPLRLMAANRAVFTSLFEIQERSLASEAFRYEQWQLANSRLNQDTSLLVHLEFQNLNTSDWSLRNAAEGNRSVQEATIVGCERAEGRWNEKQALEFQSVNDRVRLDVPGTFDALTLSTWVCVKGLDRQFNSIFMCDGFRPGTIHWLIRNDGVLGLTVFGEGVGNFQIVASPPVLTLDKLGTWLHLAAVVDGEAKQVIQYVNGVPVHYHKLKQGAPYQLGAAELGNWNAESGPNPEPALIRNLSGAVDEFELFSRALSDAEVRELYIKGKPGL